MDFGPNAEQAAFQDSVRRFATSCLNDDLVGRDRAGTFDRSSWERCASFGLQGLPVPREYGGQGADLLTTALAMEALGEGCWDGGLIFSLNAQLWSATMPLVEYGDDKQKDTYLPGMCDGSLIAAHAVTEPEAGSDAMALTTSARLDGDSYVLNGTKQFITNASVADLFIVFATLDRALGWAGLTAFLIPKGTPGLTTSQASDKMGLRTSPLGEVTLTDCRVSVDEVLGAPGAGMAVFEHAMLLERAGIMAAAVGAMQRRLDECVAYTSRRRQFGRPIAGFQAVSHTLADMKVRLEAGRLLARRAAWLADRGELDAMDASVVKLYLSEAYLQSSLDTLQLHGGYGYMAEAGLERDVRDAIGARIYSGTSQMQRTIIADRLLR
ncbi:acyl-CoA dehydrogenase family protein [Phytohabitans suffuscus]|uniref:Acyl-CoA dehydrogenase n=1 Tax=Phytohabitans suffuscus TaxID=624315 RepID=A0A6F8YF25_9ACTN|nr:acyl-CoA dehydrogenase family protein [Phytohabitans suffuscus]BCB84578.1 acyl-CoA dehydrogenase [Phytohabitans suffuscus]